MAEQQDFVYSTLHCSPAYHITQLKGRGASEAYLLYDTCCRLGHESGKAFPNLRHLAEYLHCHEDGLYRAAKLLIGGGWLIAESSKPGAPTTYRPLSHETWLAGGWTPGAFNRDPVWRSAHPCVEKIEPDYWKRDELGAAFYGATGGYKIAGPNILAGWLKLCDGNPALLIEQAKAFVSKHPLPRHFYEYPEWGKGFGGYLRSDFANTLLVPSCK